jgi:peptidoglycan/LPS O-acetylase OafA/YrhL
MTEPPHVAENKAGGARYVALDGIRGLAAIGVGTMHYTRGDIFLGAWLAVDLFFVLSGFVLMHAYSEKIANGMTFTEFAKARLLRLYPMYFLGYAIGLSVTCVKHFMGIESSALLDIAKAGVSGLFFLPYFGPPLGSAELLFPLNPPSWSLFFELAVNLVFFFWVVRFRDKTLVPLLVIAFLALEYLQHGEGGLSGGWSAANFPVGLARVVYHFFIGVLIYRHRHRFAPVLRFAGPLAVVAFLVLFQFVESRAGIFRAVRQLDVFLLAPFVVLANSLVRLQGWQARVAAWLGALSYPLYVVHVPLHDAVAFSGISKLQQLWITFPVVIVASFFLSKVDARVRAELGRRLRGRVALRGSVPVGPGVA